MFASPVPTHSEWSGPTSSAPIDSDGWSSQIDAHVLPASVDFQTPPSAVPR